MKTGDRNAGDPIERLQAGALAHREPQKTRGCPDEDKLRLLLPGQLKPKEAEKLLTHAAECDWCGMVLREAAQDLTGPPTGEEEEFAAKSAFAGPRGRRELVERIARGRKSLPPIFFRWALASGVALAALAAAVIYPQWARSPARTGKLLAEAYTKHHLTPMRLPGAKWGRIGTQMGAESSSVDLPQELLDAQPNIKRALDAHPDDPRWLQLQGEVDLIESREGPAIANLERAQSLRPNDASILAELGTAYFQRAEKTGEDQFRTNAFQQFSKACRLRPDDAALLFDCALAAQKIGSYSEASDYWRQYLSIDSKSQWAAEARRYQEEVKKNWTGSGTTPPQPPPAH